MARGKKTAQGLTPEEKLAQALVPVEEQPYVLPSNWIWLKHNSILDISGGSQPSKSFFISEPAEGYVQLYQTRDYGEHPVPVYIPNQYATKTTQYGDILLARYGGSLGKVFRAHKGAYNVALAKVIKIFPDIIDDDYLYQYYLSDFYQDFCIKASSGRSAQAGFNRDDMEKIPFPLPPLSEQRRIVDRTESIFAKLDEAKEKAQAVVDGFELRKSAILHKAFTGELTAKWREAEAIKNQWDIKKFRNFCLLKRGYDLPASQRIKGVYPLVSSSGVIDAHCEYKVKGPGVITGRSGTIGKVFIVNEDYWPLNTTLYSENLFGNDPVYVYYYLQTFDFKTYSSSTAVPTLNRNMFLDVEVSVPTLKEQAEIVRILDKLLAKENAAKEAAESVLNQIDTIKKAVLARAFRGELGTNNPAEESAVKLLKTML